MLLIRVAYNALELLCKKYNFIQLIRAFYSFMTLTEH